MTTRTRYFVIASLLVLTVGVGTGLVAYYVGFPTSAFTADGSSSELRYVPRDAAVIAYADVQEIMTSELRQRIKAAVPIPENGQREFENQTGINIETDIDRIVACAQPATKGSAIPGSGMVVASGRFDAVKIETLMREHGAQAEDYKGRRLLVGTPNTMHKNLDAIPGGGVAGGSTPGGGAPGGSDVSPGSVPSHGGNASFAIAFIKPGLVAVGSTTLVRNAVDIDVTGGDNITLNDDVMAQVKAVAGGNNAWAIGRFDALQTQAHLPANIASQLPALSWFSVSTHINGGIRGVISAEARDDEGANNLRDVVRGFLALAKMQAGSRPEFQTMIQSLELGGSGHTVALSFTVPVQVFDHAAALKGLNGTKHH